MESKLFITTVFGTFKNNIATFMEAKLLRTMNTIHIFLLWRKRPYSLTLSQSVVLIVLIYLKSLLKQSCVHAHLWFRKMYRMLMGGGGDPKAEFK